MAFHSFRHFSTIFLYCCNHFPAEQLFKKAETIINAMRTNKNEGYRLLVEAAKLGHREARSILAWARLLGTPLGPTSLRVVIDDIPNIFKVFKELADTGLPSAHMVYTQYNKQY